MGKLSVITGGGSGIGLATARLLGQQGQKVLLAGRTQGKLEAAREELRLEGIEAEVQTCDVADRAAVERLAARARELGSVAAVVHCAGLSPNMGDARTLLECNALGTVHVNECFAEVLESGSCILDVSSMAAHLMPSLLLPTRDYPLSRTDRDEFLRRMMARSSLFPKAKRPSFAYGLSKHFILWFAKTDAVRLGRRGIRVLSVSPGSFETPMAAQEEGAARYVEQSALGRFGRPEELAQVLAFCASEQASYLTGTDILCDGGLTAVGINPFAVLAGQAARAVSGWVKRRR
ncbi:MAG: SDR family oxidoreductase [Myxococcales bacterium]